MPYEEYQNFEDFKKFFGAATPLDMLRKAGTAIDQLPDWDLEALIFILYNKYPHLPPTYKARIIAMQTGVRRAVITRFYKELYGKEPSANIFERNARAELDLNLQSTPFVPPPPPVKEVKAARIAKEKAVSDKPPKQVKVKSEFAQKVSEMSLEDLIKWALELGVPQEKIDKHKAKPLGLAKMNISNMVKAKLP